MMPQISEPVSGAAKAAMFLMGLGDPLSAELLRQFEPDEIRQITSEISNLESVAPHHMVNVFREFETLSSSGRFFARGGADFARRLVEQALGPDSAGTLLNAPAPKLQESDPEMRILQQSDPQQLATFLRDENPQIIALVLSNMPAASAATMLQSLPEELQTEVVVRMASLESIAPEVFRKIAEAIGTKLKAIRQVTKSDGVRSLAGLLNHLDPVVAGKLLADVEQQNQPAAVTVRNIMFSFEDILGIDKEGMKTLLSKADRKILTTALKGTTGKIREHFTQNMSQRATEMLLEDMEALGPVRIRDVQAAQQQLVTLVRELQQQGVIATRSAGGDEYVV